MKTKAAFLIVITMAGALWGTWSFAYHRGYAHGSHDELSHWKIQSVSNEVFPKGTMTGTRELWLHADGTRTPAPRITTIKSGAKNGAKNIILSFPISE
jgi:hypothetical protein